MKRFQLEHILRASLEITGHREFIIVGSQSILGARPNAPAALLRSVEVDIYPKDSPQDSIAIDGAIGEGSMFHQTFGYYAHGVGPETATLPNGWQDRLVRVESSATCGAIGWCLDPADLAVAKLVAGRERDLPFVQEMLAHNLVTREELLARLAETELSDELRTRMKLRLEN